MSKGILAAGIVMLGLLTFAIINIVSNYSSGNELDYYLLKETTEASMVDAVDVGYYRLTGQLRIDKEKFTESFVRRFSQSVNQDRNYRIRMYDINETPPKVSVQIDSSTNVTFNSEQLGIRNRIDAILETKYNDNRFIEDLMKEGKLDYEQFYNRG